MNYTIACKILGVSKNDTLDDINKKHKKLARKYHPDINKDKDATEKTQQINDAYDYIKKNFNTKDNSIELSYEEFVSICKKDTKIILYINNIEISLIELYNHYKKYIEICNKSNIKPIELLDWIKDFECAKRYMNIVVIDNINFIYTAYISSNSIANETFTNYMLRYLTYKINNFNYSINPLQLEDFIIKYSLSNENINFKEWLDIKILGYSIDRANRNMNKILETADIYSISDNEMFEILIVLTGNLYIVYDQFYQANLRSPLVYRMIFDYKVKRDPEIMCLAAKLNQNIDVLINEYFSVYRTMSFKDYIISKILLSELNNADNKEEILKYINYIYNNNKKKQL